MNAKPSKSKVETARTARLEKVRQSVAPKDDTTKVQKLRDDLVRRAIQPEPAPLVYAPPDEPSWWAKARAWLGL